MNCRVGYVYDAAMTLHAQTIGQKKHPEGPERIQEIYKILLNKCLLEKMVAIKSREATIDELKMVHSDDYITQLEWKLRGPKGIYKQFEKSSDVYVNQSTLLAAKLAAGSTLEIVNQVSSKKIESGVAIVRPPGHHACANRAMGFCFYNNVALAAKMVSKKNKKVLIVDWDIHHGNGTQEIVSGDQNILFFSIHRFDHGD
jgi:acetoin utilization deacetylase AcuC-like enzyme